MITITNEDNMQLMARYPDKYFDLAIVDPPYGIGVDGAIHIRKPDRPSTWDMQEKYDKKEWDVEIPCKEYWDELFRVSKNQIVWGGNYFTQFLKPSKGWIFWDKIFENTFNFSHGELAWTSFEKQLLMFRMSSKAETNGGKKRIHPTQKPVQLYKWLLDKYAKIKCDHKHEEHYRHLCTDCRNSNVKILDTHLGSGSIAIACHDYGFDLTACELDKDYFDAAMKRISQHQAQTKLF